MQLAGASGLRNVGECPCEEVAAADAGSVRQQRTRFMEHPELVLASVLRGHLTPDQAAEQLSAFVTLDLDGQQQTAVYARPLPGRVKLEPGDVAYTLRRYLSGILSETELRRWAAFVTLVEGYEAPDHPSDENYYDAMWDVVHNLAAPEVFGEIVPELVTDYLRTVETL
jgi:hypothetical protein